MKARPSSRVVLLRTILGSLALLLPVAAPAISTYDYAVRVTAAVTTNPASVRLNWAADSDAYTNTIYRKAVDAASWGTVIAGLAGNVTTYLDSAVTAGTNYEYKIVRGAKEGTTAYTGYGYLIAAIDPPLVESRGTCVLVVDQTFTNDLRNELARLALDLAGDGWTVIRHDVARTASVTSVRALIQADWNADTNGVNTLFLFGRVPVPYAGLIAPDGHYPDHYGSWPADVYYADMNGTWTDVTLSNSTSGRVKNIPGDGKFDQSSIPSPVELRVGRVDLANMPAFPSPERDLLRFYLAKDHNYRHAYFAPSPQSVIDDNFGTFSGEAFAASVWRGLPAQVGLTNVVAGDWPTQLATQDCVWAYGCGGGSYTSASGVENTAGMAAGRRRAVFTCLFGSYHGDWDVNDNFLRAPLASQPSALTCAWSGRPHWFFHPMGAGFPVGYSARLTQNNSSLYSPTSGGSIHIALMGDPTLRFNPVAPPSSLALSVAGPDVTLAWQPSPDTGVSGYHIYRAATGSTTYARMTAAPVSSTSWTDAPPRTADVWYMVRAVKPVVSPSGLFTDMSQGLFNRLTVGGDVNDPPVASSFALATNEDANISFVLTGTDPDGATPFCAVQRFPEHGRLSGSPTNMTYRPDANWFGTDTFVYHASDALCDGAAATVTVTIASVNDAPVPSNQTVRATNTSPTTITLAATDADNDPLTFGIAASTTNGLLLPAGGNARVYYVTNMSATADSFRFTVNDGTVQVTGAVTLVIVTKITARPDVATTAEDVPVTINVLTNDTDSGGHALFLSSVTNPTSGRVETNGGSVLYTPATNWYGTATFRYTVTNGYAGIDHGAVTVTVTAVNDGPTAYSQSVRTLTGHGVNITLDLTDPETNAFTWRTNAPAHGVLAGAAPNVTYTPDPGYSGPDQFTFWGHDGLADGNTGVVSITVVPIDFGATNLNFVTNGVDYVYAEGVFTSIAQAAAAPVVKAGASSGGLDLTPRERNTNFAFRWEGYFLAPADAEYSFYTYARLQTQLEIWGRPVFACTQLWSETYQAEYATNTFAMEAGLHPVTITYRMGTNSSPYTYISLEDLGGDIYDILSSANLFRRTAAAQGTPLDWLRGQFGRTNDYDTLEADDPDGDTQANWVEYRAGTDPRAAASLFAVLGFAAQAGSNVVAWYATTNSGATNLLAIRRSTNLADTAWTTVASNLTRSADGTNTWVDPTPPGGAVYYLPSIQP